MSRAPSLLEDANPPRFLCGTALHRGRLLPAQFPDQRSQCGSGYQRKERDSYESPERVTQAVWLSSMQLVLERHSAAARTGVSADWNTIDRGEQALAFL